MNRGTPQAFSVDVEEYFQVSAFEDVVSPDSWDTLESRVERTTHELLDLLDGEQATGTFFTLGWVSERRPDLVRSIVDRGHELASHGFWHRKVFTQTPQQFRDDVRRAKASLEQNAGVGILGYRAPSFSLIPGTEWAYDVLLEEGYVYDSSAFPIRRRNYGNPDVEPAPHVIERQSGSLLELPLATRRLAGMRLPSAGGAYLRLLPYGLVQGIARAHVRNGTSGVFYVHPWEIDPDQPVLDVGLLTRVRHYGGLTGMKARLSRLLQEFEFRSIREVFDDLIDGLPGGFETDPERHGAVAPSGGA